MRCGARSRRCPAGHEAALEPPLDFPGLDRTAMHRSRPASGSTGADRAAGGPRETHGKRI